MIIIISIEYDDGVENAYKSVILDDGNKKKHIFNTGNIVVDYFNCIKYLILEYDTINLYRSSTFDHFVFDNPDYIFKKFNDINFIIHKSMKNYSWKKLKKYVDERS